ncbi:MAG: RNA methyltransferase [Candidatus Bathyarchaeota archaeon]|nr:RNA methyltransferase [Candidatus Bathyarchaeota archaeon]
MTKKQLIIAVPASVIADTPHLREKTAKIGSIGRAGAIFCVDEIIVYADDPKTKQHRDLELIETLLSYMETPQYLRKRLYGIKPELQFAGILPPLRTPHHPLKGKIRDLQVGEYREGVVVSKAKDGVMVDVGVERAAFLPKADCVVNLRLTVKIARVKDGNVEVELASRDEISQYWGYKVTVETRSLSRLLENRCFDLVIGTSKFAYSFQEAKENIGKQWQKAKTVLVLFGAPTRGLFEIAKDEDENINDLVDFMLNTVPNQGTETVRTEEALLATLALLNVHFNGGTR